MLRRLATLLVPVAALAACVGPYGNGRPYSGPDGYAADFSAPLAARLVPGHVGMGVQLNRPAHVAIFEIIPGEGVGLVYPAVRSEAQFFEAGFTRFTPTVVSQYRAYFSSYHGNLHRGPRFYFLVASAQPLRISRFQRSPGALRSVLGFSSYTSPSPDRVMEALVSTIVPPQPDEDWTVDVYTVWPARYDDYPYMGRLTSVYCAGDRLVVPFELVGYACSGYGRRQALPPPPVDPRNPPEEGDSTEVQVPGRRRPEPVPTTTDGSGAGSDSPRSRPEVEGEAGEPERPRAPRGGDGPRVTPPGNEPGSGDPQRPEVPAEEPSRPTPPVQPFIPTVSRPAGEPVLQPAEPARETPRVESPRVEPARETPQPESPRVEPVRETPRFEAPRPEPVRETPRFESPRPEPVRETPRSEPVRVETPRHDPPPPPPPPPPAPDPSPPSNSVQEPTTSRPPAR